MKKMGLTITLCFLLLVAFNLWSGYEIIIRDRLDKFFIVSDNAIRLNQDCWERVLRELVKYKRHKCFRNMKMVIGKVTMEKDKVTQTIEWHALLYYETPQGNIIYYDPTSNRRAIEYKKDKRLKEI